MENEKAYEIGQTYIRLDISADSNFKEYYKKFLLSKGEEYARKVYTEGLIESALYFEVELEDGSLKSRLKILGVIAISGIIKYGEIRESIDYIIQDSQKISELIANDVANDPNIEANSIGRVERRLGVPGKINRLYNDIDKLSKDRNNLTEKEKQDLIEKIHRNFEVLIKELDQPLIQLIEQDIEEQNIPLPIPNQNNDQNLHSHDVIREEELKLLSEDEIEKKKKNSKSK